MGKTYIDENNHAVPQIVSDDAGVATSNWLDAKMSGELTQPYCESIGSRISTN